MQNGSTRTKKVVGKYIFEGAFKNLRWIRLYTFSKSLNAANFFGFFNIKNKIY